MKILGTDEGLVVFDKWFREAENSLFKAELLQNYSAIDDGPSLQAWCNGDKDASRSLARELVAPWIAKRQATTASITRVRVVERPFSTYLSWQLACVYPAFQDAQVETIHLVPKEKLVNVLLPYGDFWIFDERRVIERRYEGPNNAMAGAMLVEGQRAVERYLALRDELLDNVSDVESP